MKGRQLDATAENCTQHPALCHVRRVLLEEVAFALHLDGYPWETTGGRGVDGVLSGGGSKVVAQDGAEKLGEKFVRGHQGLACDVGCSLHREFLAQSANANIAAACLKSRFLQDHVPRSMLPKLTY